MATARLWIDAAMVRWALVQCDHCRDVSRHRAQNAAEFPVKCRRCLNQMDAREIIKAALVEADREDLHPNMSIAPPANRPAATKG